MHEISIIFNGGFPKDLLPGVEQAVQAAVAVLPRWCSTVYVDYTATYDEQPNAVVTTIASPKYRTAKVNIHPSWANEPPEWRHGVMRHELSHVTLAPLNLPHEMYDATLASLDLDPTNPALKILRAALEKVWTDALEGVTEDLADITGRLLEMDPPRQSSLQLVKGEDDSEW